MAKKGGSSGGGGGGKATVVANSSGNIKAQGGAGSAIGTAIGTGIAGPVGGVFGGMLGGAAEGAINAATPTFSEGITEEDINKARDNVNRGFRKGSDILREGVKSGSGLGIGSLTPQTKRQIQDDKIRAIDASGLLEGKTPAQRKAFFENFRQGELGKKGRGIVKEALTGSGYKYDPATGKYVSTAEDPFLTTPSDQLRDQGIENTGDIFSEMGDLTSLIGEDVKGALDYKQNLRDYFSNLTGSMDQEGLTAQDQADLDSQYALGRRRVQETLRDDLQRTMGDLTQRGFSSSSLTNQALQRGAFDPLSRNIVDLEASQAGMRQDILNARASRRGQSFRNLLGAGAQLGSGGFSSLTSGIVSPTAYGGFTDPASAEFMYDALTDQAGRYDQRGLDLAEIQTKPRFIQTGGL